jgi:hypothetical protein
MQTIITELTKESNTEGDLGPCHVSTCEAAHRWRLPCAHLLRARRSEDNSPLLSLDDIPDRWQSEAIWRKPGLAGPPVKRTQATAPPVDWAADSGRFLPNFVAQVEPYLSNKPLPGAKQLCVDLVNNLKVLYRSPAPRPAPAEGDDPMCRDPATVEGPGAPFSSPGDRSPLNLGFRPAQPKPKPKQTKKKE